MGSPTFSTRIISVPSGLEINPAVVTNTTTEGKDKDKKVHVCQEAGKGDRR